MVLSILQSTVTDAVVLLSNYLETEEFQLYLTFFYLFVLFNYKQPWHMFFLSQSPLIMYINMWRLKSDLAGMTHRSTSLLYCTKCGVEVRLGRYDPQVNKLVVLH